MRIGIDLMGSDSSPKVLFDAVLRAAQQFDSSHTLVGIATPSVINELQVAVSATSFPPNSARIEFLAVSNAITMRDEPLPAVSRKKGSSLVVGIRLLKKGRINAFVTAGNTGALIASATLMLPRLPGIRRPALLVVIPTLTGSVAVLDVGGNVYCKSQQLVQFAQMGSAYQRCSSGLSEPRVGLLNVGVESQKGTSVVREAYQIMQQVSSPQLNFIGNVEGGEVFQGSVDVLVTDGFTGNVFLKTAEGVSSFIFDCIKRSLKNAPSQASNETFEQLRHRFHHSEYPGAIVCGVEGVVIKCHGNSSSEAMLNGIKGAYSLVEKEFISKMKQQLEM